MIKDEFSVQYWEYLNIRQIVNDPHYPFTIGQLRTLLNKRQQNGLFKAIRHIGKCLYFRRDLWEEWIESHQEKGDEGCMDSETE